MGHPDDYVEGRVVISVRYETAEPPKKKLRLEWWFLPALAVASWVWSLLAR